jgi:hypothetical protein
MSMEPDHDGGRLTRVTAHPSGSSRPHDLHDRLLVGRWVVGDALAPDETASVRAQIAGCADCVGLADEIRLVQAAVATSLAPTRPRDFFLTPAQAESLRPNRWQRFLARLSAPRMTALRPVAGATLAIGIVLVGASAVLPRAEATIPPDETAMLDASPVATDPAVLTFQSAPEGSAAAEAAPGEPDATIVTDPTLEGTGKVGDASALPRLMAPMESVPVETSAARDLMADVQPRPSPAPRDDAEAPAVASRGDVLGPTLLVLGFMLAVASAIVLVLSWLARRATDPLLR